MATDVSTRQRPRDDGGGTSCRASEWPYLGVTVAEAPRVIQLLLLRLNLRGRTEAAVRG